MAEMNIFIFTSSTQLELIVTGVFTKWVMVPNSSLENTPGGTSEMKSYSKKKSLFYLWAVSGSIFPLLSHWVCHKLCPREFGVLHQRSMNTGLLWKWWTLQYCTFSKIKNIKETTKNLWQTVSLPSKYCSLTSVLKGLMATFWHIYIHSPLSAFAHLSEKQNLV